MKFVAFKKARAEGLAVEDTAGQLRGLTNDDAKFPGSLDALVRMGPAALRDAAFQLAAGPVIDPSTIAYLPPFRASEKIVCVGLNYFDHNVETGNTPTPYPALFSRFTSSLVGHGAPILMPPVSDKLDYEAEMVAVIGKAGRNISREAALEHIAGYSIFNDGSIRDYQMKTAQWTIGKNFDSTGAFGPGFVTADALPPGGAGLRIECRLNGKVMQSASTSDLIFDVAELVAILSEAMTLQPGDLIVSGTPGGVGMARTPPVWMKPGDLCEVEIEGIGTLSNPIAAG